MKKYIISFLVIKFIEKVYSDGKIEQLQFNEIQPLTSILLVGLLKNLPFTSIIFNDKC